MKNLILLIMMIVFFSFYPAESIHSQSIWTQLPGLEGGYVEVLASNSLGELFIGTSTSGVFKSTNNGTSWVQKNNGLTNSNIISLAINNNGIIFAGTFEAGIFRSTDHGDSWIEINNGLSQLNIRSIAFGDSGYTFVCSGPTPFTGRVFRSKNNGDNWTLASTGLLNRAVFSLAIDSSKNVYAGLGLSTGFYISTNNGLNWAARNNGLTDKNVLTLTINKSNNIIYAGTYTGVFKTTDGGLNWSSAGLGGNIWALATNSLGEVFAGSWAGSIYRSTDNGSTWISLKDELTIVQDLLISQNGDIYAATFGPGVLCSSDNGNSWVTKSVGISKQVINCVNINTDGSLFVGSGMIYRSTNNGITWSAVKGGSGNSWFSSIVRNRDGVIFAANTGYSGGHGIFRSIDNGDHWLRLNNGLIDSTIWTITLDNNDNLFVGANSGVYKSTNNGNNWINIGLTSNAVYVIAIKDDFNIFAGTGPTGVWRTTNAGNSWSQVLLPPYNVHAITIDGVGNIFVGGWDGDGGVFRSTTNGDNWVTVNSGLSDLNISSLTSGGNAIYAGTHLGGIFKSTDLGANWVSYNEGFQTFNDVPALQISGNYIYSGTTGFWRRTLNAIAPSAPTNLAAFPDTFFIGLSWDDNSNNEDGFKIERKNNLPDFAGQWVLIDSVGANIHSYTNTGLTPNTDYFYRIYAYNEFGNSAYSDSVGVITTLPVELTSFALSVSDNNIQIDWSTATELNNKGFDIERRMDFTWEKIGFMQGKGTSTENVKYSFKDKFDQRPYKGIIAYRLKQIDIGGAYKYSNELNIDVDFTPKEYAMYQSYPNPFNPSTTIKYVLPFESNVKLTVYNALGQAVEVLQDGLQGVGYYDVRWNANGCASGLYIYRIIARSSDGSKTYSSIRKMLLLK